MRAITVLSLVMMISGSAFACTGFLVSGSPNSVVAKNFDFFTGQGMFYVNKRGTKKRSLFVEKGSARSWTSRFASLTLTQSGLGFPFEGMNDAGLSVTSFQLKETQIPGNAGSLPSIDYLQWIQYILDTSADLNEAIANARGIRVADGSDIHYFACDVSEHCAVFEYIAGRLVIHAGNDLPYQALANNSYEDSQTYLRKVLTRWTPQQILTSGSIASLDRFSRAALWSKDFNPALHDEVTYAFEGLANLAQYTPSWGTFWSMAFALKTRVAYVKTFLAPGGTKSVDLKAFERNCRSGTQVLDLNAPVFGDVTKAFVPLTASINAHLIDSNPLLPAPVKQALEAYAETCKAD